MAKPYRGQPDDKLPERIDGNRHGLQIRTSLIEKDRVLRTLFSGSNPLIPLSGGAALTRVNDTNVTLTLGGSPATALLNAASLTLGWAGTLAIARGGTGQSTTSGAFAALSPMTTDGDLITRSGGAPIRLPIGANSFFLQSNGTLPGWIDLLGGATVVSGGWHFVGQAQFNNNGDANWPIFQIDAFGSADNRWAEIQDQGLGGGVDLYFTSVEARKHTLPDMSGTYVLVGAESSPASGFIAKVDLTAQTAAIGATQLANSVFGYMVVHYTLETTTLGVGAGTIQFQINYTDDVGATTQTSTALALTATGRTRGTLEVYAMAGITYQTNLTGIIGTSQYALHVRCEFLG